MIGLAGVLIVCLSQGVALPLRKKYDYVHTGQMLMMRGGVSALLAAIFMFGSGHSPNGELSWLTFTVGLTFGLAAVGLYQAIKFWDTSLVITVVAATPVVNVLAAVVRGEAFSIPAVITFPFLLTGVVLAVEPWRRRSEEEKERFNLKAGLFWAIWGVIWNGLYYEALAQSQWNREVTVFQDRLASMLPLAFWQAVAVGTIGGVMSVNEDWGAFQRGGKKLFMVLTGWAVLAGFAYFLGNILAFQGIPRQMASVLLQLETPTVIAMAVVLLPPHKRQKLSPLQWAGVSLGLMSGAILSFWV